jgi:putative endonuclease
MTQARQRLGRDAEALVADTLERRGMRIVARNARTATVRGEIDLIALDGRALVFIEIKARRPGSRAGPDRPVLAVGHRKRHKLRSLALAWLRDRDGSVPRHAALRFDVVGLLVDPRDRVVEWEHLRGAF